MKRRIYERIAIEFSDGVVVEYRRLSACRNLLRKIGRKRPAISYQVRQSGVIVDYK